MYILRNWLYLLAANWQGAGLHLSYTTGQDAVGNLVIQLQLAISCYANLTHSNTILAYEDEMNDIVLSRSDLQQLGKELCH